MPHIPQIYFELYDRAEDILNAKFGEALNVPMQAGEHYLRLGGGDIIVTPNDDASCDVQVDIGNQPLALAPFQMDGVTQTGVAWRMDVERDVGTANVMVTWFNVPL